MVAQDQLDEPNRYEWDREQRRQAVAPRPEPGAPAAEHVVLAHALVVDPEQARPGDEPAQDEVDEATEADDEQEGRRDRPADRPSFVVVEPREGRRARQQR